MIYDLPTALKVNGREYPIRTDYRGVLRILMAFEDPDLTDGEKAYICLHVLYEDADAIPRTDVQAAFDAAIDFIDMGRAREGPPRPKTMDWAQDAPLYFPAVNRAAGMEVRSADYVHWWTFMGWFMEIREGTFSTVLALRHKKSRGQKLEKGEREFWRENRAICELKPRYSESERRERARLKAAIGRREKD